MKRSNIFLLAVALAVVTLIIAVNRREASRTARELAAQRAAWEVERAELEAALDQARGRRPQIVSVPVNTMPMVPAATVAMPDAAAMVAQLAVLQPTGSRAQRQALALLEQLVQMGAPALPAIREFLASGKDLIYDTNSKGSRDVQFLAEALLPGSLRMALFQVISQIGGADAEQVLAESLGRSGRGLEVALLTQLLETLAPGKYRDNALSAARELLARNTVGADRGDRDYLFGVLKRFNDSSYVGAAQAQLVQADGKVDRSALKYLQNTLGDQSLPLAAQLYQDARVSGSDAKEPLARLALAFVGANPQAEQLFHTAVLDGALTPDARRNLIEDLNQDGLSSKRNLSPEDLALVTARYRLTQTYLQQDYVQGDRVLLEAFKEADKDLRNMLQRAAAANAAAAVK